MKQKSVSFLTREISERVSGACWGNQDLPITNVCTLERPVRSGLLFMRGGSFNALKRLLSQHSEICVLVDEKIAEAAAFEGINSSGNAVIAVADPYVALLDLLSLFYEPSQLPSGVHPTAQVHPSAKVGENVRIGPFCVIGLGSSIADGTTLFERVSLYENVSVGKRCVLHSGVSIREECIIGNDCTIHNHTVIGADGFGYIPDPKAGLRKVPQVGRVIISDSVEIGANSCIDRGAFGDTTIGRGTKIDNLVQIGHNVSIGSHSIVCGKAGIGGSVTIGDGVVIGGHVGVADHVTIVSGVRVGGKSGVINSLTEPGDYLGFPAIPAGRWRRMMASLTRPKKRGSSSSE